MSRILPKAPSPRPVAWAKAILAISALLLLLSTSVFAAHVLIETPWESRGSASQQRYQYVEDGRDWLAYADLGSFAGDHVSGTWTTNKGLDRMFLTRMGDVDRLLAGGTPTQIIQEWRPGGRDWQQLSVASNHGYIEFEMPASVCPPPTGACTQESRPVVVWLRGDDWVGTPRRSLTLAYYDYQEGDAVGWQGPVGFRHAVLSDELHGLTPWYVGAVVLSALACVVSASAWAWLARRAPRQDEPDAPPFQEVGASEMLRLVRLAELYVATISRYFLLSGAFIVLATGLVMYLALPPLLADAASHYRFTAWYGNAAEITFVSVPLLVAAVAALFWAAQLRDVRRELARWRRFRQGLDEQAAAILAA